MATEIVKHRSVKKDTNKCSFKNSALVGIPPNMPAVFSLNICSKRLKKKKKKRIEQEEVDKRKPEPTGKGFHQSHLENTRDG